MKIYHNFFLRSVFFMALLAIFFSSCVPMKRIKYLQQEVAKGDSLRTHFENKKLADYRIQPGDNLYIKVNSAISTTDNLFLNEANQSSNYYNDIGIYLNSYPVSDSGHVDFPFVGKIYLKGLSIEQAKDTIQAIVDDYLKGTTVIVRLANFKVTILGEINRPGEYSVYQNKLNIFDAIAYAGDMTTFAKRDDVYMIRETKTGTKVIHLNLNDVSILESEYYTLMPKDIIYIPPVKGKNFAFSNFPYALIFTTITTTLLLINFFKTN
ncbi:MAG: polysaccharide biosynthesis/export family protein [Bacteroidales bacterium]|nr:polysaccharide biosynthesis/export family protein [Bacteroidales bacterium]